MSKNIVATVIKKKMNKTVTVLIKNISKHFIYEKIIINNKKIHVHDEKSISDIGDLILIKECRPISKIKSWILVKIIKKNN
ncbi:30S ribosomal protein S17 [endosymbiont of Sipalinus gigas]|uniref:30S ribosomal protein S17 n=1 Tax=endosymbiont of Sipalinus gigas TaxID=1972134 RepID=UPI000DC6E416|nr:30S ribosomal protein S17 [endosymbiont of Sipalinus gigas]BBA85256.1 30S ribosomal protein S17 [endosymbiont of Sipalinus gigas]